MTELRLDWCDVKAARYAVEHWHYSKSMPVGKMVKIGVWEDNKFIGVVLFAQGNNQFQGNSLGLKMEEICELVRVALTDHKTSVTKIIKISLIMLRKINPGLRCCFSYADPEQNHTGGIYQGGNWVFIGTGGSGEAFFDNSGKRIHSRNVSKDGYKEHFGKMVISYRSDDLERRKLQPKYKYLYPLDDAMRKQIAPLAKPYPKRETCGTGETDNAAQSNAQTGGASPTVPLYTEVSNGTPD